jgi:hypothetical protein
MLTGPEDSGFVAHETWRKAAPRASTPGQKLVLKVRIRLFIFSKGGSLHQRSDGANDEDKFIRVKNEFFLRFIIDISEALVEIKWVTSR